MIFVSADSKGLADENLVSADSRGVIGPLFATLMRGIASADSEWVTNEFCL
jgi:hypothetical protein